MWFKGIEAIDWAGLDWAGLDHAYGPAGDVPEWLRQMRSPDPEARSRAFGDLYNQVLHQGSVYEATAAVVPFVAAVADAPDTPDRGSTVAYLAAIGDSAIEQCEGKWTSEPSVAAMAALRERAERFAAWSTDPDPRVRRAAAPALAWCFADAEKAATQIRARLEAEADALTQVALVGAAAALALREHAVHEAVVAGLGALAEDRRRIPEVRLAALVSRMECAPDAAEGALGALLGLLGEIAPREPRPDPAVAAPQEGVPPQVNEAFRDLDRQAAESSVVTDLLKTAHRALGDRLQARTALLLAQIGHGDGPVRLAGIGSVSVLVGKWRGDFRGLVGALGAQLGEPDRYTARAAKALEACGPMAEPARESLAAYVERSGPGAWAAADAVVREAHQNAVRALARLDDERALPSLLHAFESGVDPWRAVQVAGELRSAAAVLAPVIARYLSGLDLSGGHRMSVNASLTALGALGDPATIPVIIAVTASAVGAEEAHGPSPVPACLKALAEFGPAAADAVELLRGLTSDADAAVRCAAAKAWWRITGDRDGTRELAAGLLGAPAWFAVGDGASLLGELGAEAAASLPALRRLSGHRDHWVRVKAASAVWAVGGADEDAFALAALRKEWEANRVVAREVVPVLARRGEAARPLLDLVEGELANGTRDGFTGIAADERLAAQCRAVVAGLR
ncbi:HEAT repeat domain-containing protein [Glycomyces paridis]|uniref:HEAT repeat domain-containing protein n=1 Tax=Glycomyces paridis TaxID=2126555 RepID=A0A4S8P2E7_9ACTN|nr:HEAT repeat domain-containing protein [Glycomyces paridis]THV24253.1 HEAT repeat domain-containing protein [Glycomyces paridis]